jgi:hypothetical protein
MSNSTQTLSQAMAQLEPNVAEFMIKIAEMVTGLPESTWPASERDQIVLESNKIYLEFMEKFIEENKGKRVANQFRIFATSGDGTMFDRFKDLEEGFAQAHQEFVNTVNSL